MDFIRSYKKKAFFVIFTSYSLYLIWHTESGWSWNSGETVSKVVKKQMPGSANDNTSDAIDSKLLSNSLKKNNFEKGWGSWSMRQELRKHILMTSCHEIGMPSSDRLERLLLYPEQHFKQLLVDDEKQLIYCYIPQVSNDDWLGVWTALSEDATMRNLSSVPMTTPHYRTKEERLSKNAKIKSDLKLKLESYTKLIIVQNPYHHLLTTYLKKIHNPKDNFREAVASWSQKGMPTSSANPKINVSWTEFVDMLTHRNAQMVDNSLDTYEVLCHPCAIEYDIIAKAETLEEDSARFLRYVSAPEGVHLPRGSAISSSSWYSQFNKLWKDHEKSLSLEELSTLYKRYERDFKLFGYDQRLDAKHRLLRQ